MARGGRRAGAGRKPGSKSKLTIALGGTLSETLKGYETIAIAAIVEIAGDHRATASARASCALAIIDRIHGKPKQAHEHSGPDGGPIETRELSDLELARRIAFILETAARKG